MVQPVEEPEPEETAGELSTNGKHALWFGLDRREAAVAPGSEATLTAHVVNKGSVVEGVDVRVLGVPESWVRVEPPRVNLDVGGHADLAIRVAPPRAATTRSGPVELEVALWSSTNPQVRCAQHVRVDVGSFHDLEVEPGLHEATTRRQAAFLIALRNRGNHAMGAAVEAGAGPAAGGKVVLQFDPSTVAIPAGDSASVTVRARAAQWVVFGTPVLHTIPVRVQGHGEEQAVDLHLLQLPLLPSWTPKLLRVLIPLLVLMVGFAGFSWWKSRPHAVPNVVGQQAALAQAQLAKAGFKSVQIGVADPKAPHGVVLSEVPSGGTRHRHGAIVSIGVSSGPAQVALQDLAQMPEAEARDVLTREGLAEQVVHAPDPSVPAGIVTGQQPGPGTPLAAGATVKVTVSSGPPVVSVPSIRGLSEADAIALLGQVNLRYARGSTATNDQLAGQVLNQSPPPGAMVASGSQVTSVVAVPTPSTPQPHP
jgi:beta-lactam-binding protein with PASTA domain